MYGDASAALRSSSILNLTSKCSDCLHACRRRPTVGEACTLTFDRMQHSVVQGLAARVIGGRANACSTTVGQSIPDTSKQEWEQRKTKIAVSSLVCMQIKEKKNFNFYINTKRLLTLHETLSEIDSDTQTERTNLSKKAASSLLSSTLCLVPALTWQFMSWARDMYTDVPAKDNQHRNEPQTVTDSYQQLWRFIVSLWHLV